MHHGMSNSVTILLPKLLLLLALISGQLAYAEHSADFLDGSHEHASECLLCHSQAGSQAVGSSCSFDLDVASRASNFEYSNPSIVAGSETCNAIRAPPFIL